MDKLDEEIIKLKKQLTALKIERSTRKGVYDCYV